MKLGVMHGWLTSTTLVQIVILISWVVGFAMFVGFTRIGLESGSDMKDYQNHLLASGTHLGFDWFVLHNGMGYRCGYVKIPVGHPWFGKDYNSLDVDVHGGLTYGPDEEGWVGFDCAHLYDAQDRTLPHSHQMKNYNGESVVRTTAFVRSECESLCQQAASVTVETI